MRENEERGAAGIGPIGALALVVVTGLAVASGFAGRSCGYKAGHAAGAARGQQAGFAQGLAEGLKLAPRTASTPEIGALLMCREALAEAEDQAQGCGAAIDEAVAAEARGYARGHDDGYGLGRTEWSAQPWECEGRWQVRQ